MSSDDLRTVIREILLSGRYWGNVEGTHRRSGKRNDQIDNWMARKEHKRSQQVISELRDELFFGMLCLGTSGGWFPGGIQAWRIQNTHNQDGEGGGEQVEETLHHSPQLLPRFTPREWKNK